ncbi:HNH endonuclease [Variovorax sp. Varisp62]|uniref:HNH endonuclease n=1 Tax=Variovorax sp. Varisp62 TaxID=3243049 RepID=UPI0039B4D9F8
MTATQDELFTTFLRDKANEAFRVVKPWPGHFLRMLESKGGYQTALDLIAKSGASDGFTRLWEAGRLDLSVEALVVESQWRAYFDPQLVQMAEKVLRRAGYEPTLPKAPTMDGPDIGAGQDRARRSPFPFELGSNYARSDVFRILGFAQEPKGGPWFTGYAEHDGDWFVFCNVGAPGRTGHDYQNHFEGDRLVWFGKGPSRLGHEQIQRLLLSHGYVYIFFRLADRDPFTFAGVAKPFQVYDQAPVKVVWEFYTPTAAAPQQAATGDKVVEGTPKVRQVKVYERDRGARLKCIGRWGWTCAVCTFDFADVYGELGMDFIHVHHVKPLSEIGEAYELDPIEDLRPVCPNCHAMLHRRTPALGVDELRDRLRQASSVQVQSTGADLQPIAGAMPPTRVPER